MMSKKLTFTIINTILLLYFIFHSIYGNKGMIAYTNLNQDYVTAYDNLQRLEKDRILIEHKVKLIKTGDKDIIDEVARKFLGFATPQEKVFKNTNTE